MLFISRQLHYFIITAEMRSLKDAATRLCITPSPLGRSLAELESQLGTRLFFRSPDGIRLTPQGGSFYNQVYPLYQQLTQLGRRYQDHHEPGCNILKVASDGIATGFCTLFADKLSALTPPHYLQMQVLAVPDIGPSLRRHVIDACIVSDPLADEQDLYRQYLSEEPIRLAVSPELADHDVIWLMKEFPLAQYDIAPDNGHLRRVLAWFHLLGISPVILRFTEMAQRLSMVEQSLAVSLVPASTIRDIRRDTVTLLDLPDDSPSVCRYVYCLQEQHNALRDPLALLESSIRQWQSDTDTPPTHSSGDGI
ncbi:LysR family transcriptional regulator [Klebsiella aerogenes]|nr:LysR family transcriptional regulator [Klebsiella aerogenes]ELY3087845.1 LysR family transcriptional regulator [Klebsiella aerogenes]